MKNLQKLLTISELSNELGLPVRTLRMMQRARKIPFLKLGYDRGPYQLNSMAGMKDDLYDVLGLNETATPEEIKGRFRFLSHAYHPDKFSTDAHRQSAETEFKRINDAYQILSDPIRRAHYDEFRQADPQPPQVPPQTPTSTHHPCTSSKPKILTTFLGLVLAAILKACWNSGPSVQPSAGNEATAPAAQDVPATVMSNIKLDLHYDEIRGEPILAGSLQNDTGWKLVAVQIRVNRHFTLSRDSAVMPQPVPVQPPPDTSRLFGLTFLHQSIDPLSTVPVGASTGSYLMPFFPSDNSYVKYVASWEYSIESAKGWPQHAP